MISIGDKVRGPVNSSMACYVPRYTLERNANYH